MDNNKKEISADELLRQLKANLAQTKPQSAPADPEPVTNAPMAADETPAIEKTAAPEKTAPKSRGTKYRFKVSSKAEWEAAQAAKKQAAAPQSTAREDEAEIDALMKKFLTPEEYDKFSRKKSDAATEELRDNYREYTIPEPPKPKDISESIRDAEAYVSTLESEPEANKHPVKHDLDDGIERISVPRRNGRPDKTREVVEDDAATREFDSASVLDVLKKYDKDKQMPVPSEDSAKTKVLDSVSEDEAEAERARLEDENLRRINEFDETDVNLMIAFGMEDELAKTVGFDKVTELEEDLDRKGEDYQRAESISRAAAEIKPAFEYEAQSQTKQIFAKYKAVYCRLLLKLGIAILLIFGIFLYENIGIFGGSMPEFLSQTKYTVVYTMVDLQLLLLVSALAWRSLLGGAKSIIRLQPSPSGVTAVLLAMTVFYNIGACLLGRGQATVLYNFPASLAVFFTLCGEFMDIKREIYSFNVVSSKKLKYAMGRISGADATLETQAFEEYIPGDPAIFRVCKAGFINGFYRRTATPSASRGVLSFIIPFSLILCAVFFVVGAIVTGDARVSMSTAYIALIFTMPMSALITFSYPFFRASHEAFGMDSAIIGDGSLDEYSEASVVSFEDKDVFPSTGVKVKSVKVYGDNRIDRVIFNAASLFRVIGGPLSDVLDIATLELGHTDDVEIVETDADGIEAVVGGHHIYMGKEDYLRRNRFIPVRDDDDEAVENGGKISIMYMVEDGEVAAKLYVEYMIDPDFEFVIKRLYKAGVCVGIKTFDPNINDRMLNMRIKLAKYPVKILECRNLDDITRTAENVDSGIVSKSSSKSLLQTLLLCDKVLHVIKTSVMVKAIAMIIGAVITGVVLFLGIVPEVSSIYAALYQIFWILPVIVIAKLFI